MELVCGLLLAVLCVVLLGLWRGAKAERDVEHELCKAWEERYAETQGRLAATREEIRKLGGEFGKLAAELHELRQSRPKPDFKVKIEKEGDGRWAWVARTKHGDLLASGYSTHGRSYVVKQARRLFGDAVED